jgi:hypothetical protein
MVRSLPVSPLYAARSERHVEPGPRESQGVPGVSSCRAKKISPRFRPHRHSRPSRRTQPGPCSSWEPMRGGERDGYAGVHQLRPGADCRLRLAPSSTAATMHGRMVASTIRKGGPPPSRAMGRRKPHLSEFVYEASPPHPRNRGCSLKRAVEPDPAPPARRGLKPCSLSDVLAVPVCAGTAGASKQTGPETPGVRLWRFPRRSP